MPPIIILSFAAGVCFLTAIIAIALTVNRKGNQWYGIFLVTVGLALLSKAVWDGGLHQLYPSITPISELTRFMIAPCFYFSVWYYTRLEPIPIPEKIAHFLPSFLFILFVSIPYFSSFHILVNLNPSAVKWLGLFVNYAILCQIIFYWVLSYRLLTYHHKNIRSIFSSIDTVNLSWISKIMLLQFLLCFFFIVNKLTHNESINYWSTYLYLGVVVFVNINLTKQKEILFIDVQYSKQEQALVEESKPKGRLNVEKVLFFKTKLDEVLLEETIYTDPDINLSMLSEKVGLSMNDLSYLINSEYNVSFYTLINNLRIEKVKQLLLREDYRHLTILGIAYEVGFTNKSTFNNTFKKHTGLTPSEYVMANKARKEVQMYPLGRSKSE
jgi:AraC-like DNA-binding protein